MDDATILVWIELRDTTGKKYRGDFASSLDAMAEAEATLTSEERFMYGAYIADGRECGVGHWDTLLFAPARTRALALLAATKNRVTATKEQTP